MPGGVPPSPGQLRPRRVGEVLDAAIQLYRRSARSMWALVLAVILPVTILQQIVIAASLPGGAFVSKGVLYLPAGSSAAGLDTTVGALLGGLAVLLVNGALALAMVEAQLGNALDWRESLHAAGGRLGSLLGLSIMYTAVVAIAFLVLVVPGIWLMVAWAVAIPALMCERLGAVQALQRSHGLVRGRWWATFAALLAALIMLFVANVGLTLVFGAIASGLTVSSLVVWQLLNLVRALVVDLISYPFISAVVAVVYIDLRVRREGVDLETLVRSLRPRPGPG